MKVILGFLLLFIPGIFAIGNQVSQTFDRADIYAAMASTNITEINTALTAVQQSDLADKEAFEGALLMKKAGLLSKAKEKLKVFKSGREKLEAAIRSNEDNIEYRFLRLMIQENVPKVVGYKKEIQADSKLITASYKKLSPVVQQAVKDYSKTSKALSTTDF